MYFSNHTIGTGLQCRPYILCSGLAMMDPAVFSESVPQYTTVGPDHCLILMLAFSVFCRLLEINDDDNGGVLKNIKRRKLEVVVVASALDDM